MIAKRRQHLAMTAIAPVTQMGNTFQLARQLLQPCNAGAHLIKLRAGDAVGLGAIFAQFTIQGHQHLDIL